MKRTFSGPRTAAGVVVGYSGKSDDAGNVLGEWAVRWDASGAVTELGNLGTGAADETGRGEGTGYTVNLPVPAGSGGEVFVPRPLTVLVVVMVRIAPR